MLKDLITDAISTLFAALEYINKSERKSEEATQQFIFANIRRQIEEASTSDFFIQKKMKLNCLNQMLYNLTLKRQLNSCLMKI